jgi:hypothetical protein
MATLLTLAASEPPPAGGGETLEVVLGTIGFAIATALMLFVIAGHRSGRLKAVDRLVAYSERASGLPGWAALPLAVAGGSLLIAVFGMYWDISIHLDEGRDPGPFANVSHYFILVGLFGILFAGALAISLPRESAGPSAVRIGPAWQAPLGGVLIFACAAFALSGFPLDDLWHRLFGQDVTLWGPTHLLLFGAAALSTLGTWILFAEGVRVAERRGTARPSPRFRFLSEVSLAGALLIALSTFQGEFDFSVPQFRLDFHPILLMVASSIALVAARVRIGRGGALGAVAFFLLVRGVLSLLVGPLFGHTTLHFPLYLAEAACVELVALRFPRDRPVAFGAAAGVAIGTVGLAAEWAWSHVWWVIPWPSSMLPEAAIAAFAAAVGGGVIGGFVGSALGAPLAGRFARPRLAVPAAALAVLAAVVWATPISDGEPVKAQLTTRALAPPPERTVAVTARLDPPDAAEGARWFTITAWQGGGSVVDRLEKVAPGVYRSTKAIPVHGNWKSTLRLHEGTAVQGLPLFMPRDTAIPAREIPVEPRMTRSFTLDKKLLQREQKQDVAGWLTLFAYLSVLAIGIGLVASLAVGLRRLERSSDVRAAR